MLVRDNFADGDMLGWDVYGGSFSVAPSGGRLEAAKSLGGNALLDTNFTDLVLDVELGVEGVGGDEDRDGDAGVVFRVTNLTANADGYDGYYAGITASGAAVLRRLEGGLWHQVAEGGATSRTAAGAAHHLRVRAVGASIEVYVDDLSHPEIAVEDGTYTSGRDGVRVQGVAAWFGNVSVARPDS